MAVRVLSATRWPSFRRLAAADARDQVHVLLDHAIDALALEGPGVLALDAVAQSLVPLVPTIFSPLRPVPGLWPLKLRQRAPLGYSNSA